MGRWVPFLNRWAEVAPACCNACRSCTATNLAALAGILAAPFLQLRRRQVERASGNDSRRRLNLLED